MCNTDYNLGDTGAAWWVSSRIVGWCQKLYVCAVFIETTLLRVGDRSPSEIVWKFLPLRCAFQRNTVAVW